MAKNKFLDRLGTEWVIVITNGAVKRVRQETDIPLADTFSQGGSVLRQVVNDPFKLGAVLWVLCREQAGQLQLDEDAFADRFDAETIERSSDALIGGLTDFFLRGQSGQAMKERFLAQMARLDARMAKVIEARLSDAETDKVIEEAIASMPNRPSATSPASPGSPTPGPSPFAS